MAKKITQAQAAKLVRDWKRSYPDVAALLIKQPSKYVLIQRRKLTKLILAISPMRAFYKSGADECHGDQAEVFHRELIRLEKAIKDVLVP